MASLPHLNSAQAARSQDLTVLICQKIAQSGGAISFAEFMHAALYTPQLGYYSGGAQKFGLAGDFVTASEISPLFAQTIANQAAQVLQNTQGDICELGAGTGQFSADCLLALAQKNSVPKQYFILEVSAHLRQVQRETCLKKLPETLFNRIVWLDCLPKDFCGFMFANEVLDALPVHLLQKTGSGWQEQYVAWDENTQQFLTILKPLSHADLAQDLPADLPENYVTEACPAAAALVRAMAENMEKGAIVLVDYGFAAREYYHPQRAQGTLMCHFQHYAHGNALTHVGAQDITAHVDFSAVAQAGVAAGLRLEGFVSHAQGLINCGILQLLNAHSPDSPQFMQLAAAAQKYCSPAEMGDLFKLIGFSKNMDFALLAFSQGDKTHTL